MPTLNVVNLKCGGCEASVAKALTNLGATQVKVDTSNQTVTYQTGDKAKLIQKLSQMGYPEVNSPQAKSFLKKAKSYASCLIGKISS